MLLLLCTFSDATPASFIFGDSLVDIGNNNYLPLSLAKANLYPNGIDYGSGIATGRFSNGRTAPDFVFEKLGAPIPQPYLNPTTRGSVLLNGVSYASGAGGILDSTGSNYIQRLSFNTQLTYFQKNVVEINNLIGQPRASEILSDALYIVVFGSNDYINNYLLSNSATSRQYTTSQFQDLLISTFRKQLMTLYNLGARKIVTFALGPLGCIPSQVVTGNTNGTCLDTVNSMCRGFNAALRPMLTDLNARHPDAKFCIGDAYNAISQFMSNPAQYGFEFTTTGCCGSGPYNGQLGCLPASNLCTNRSTHLFWDPFHPTDRTNSYLADRFFSGGPSDISPFNIKQLIAM
ncbi:hypothetical protein KC19_2G101900 [Ceratodon purpureus]|uniref:Uncharacterized protein n=1 Tax=Ceratodon purpureus TaxID=3225 RepID=A0A8T0ITX1_CERPU|nr:hypothetical protein KC19_2G101900 [Ceratodon purpureus]